jgi:hypothetical protein
MPSFKERFRPSRKYKKNKEAGAPGTDESATVAVASGTSTNPNNASTTAGAAAAAASTGTTVDEHTGPRDQCE